MQRNDLDLLKEKRIRDYNQEVTALSRIEKEIDELLADVSIPNDEKLKTFTMLNNKFDILKPKASALPLIKDNVSVPTLATIDGVIEQNGAQIIDDNFYEKCNLPKQYRNKITEFLTTLKHNPNIIAASPNGELIINGNIIADSSFIESIREFYIHSQAHNTIGQTQLLHALSNINISPSLISNRDVRTKYNKIKFPQFGQGMQTKLKSNTPPNSHSSIGLIHYNKLTHPNSHLEIDPPPGKRPKVIFIYK